MQTLKHTLQRPLALLVITTLCATAGCKTKPAEPPPPPLAEPLPTWNGAITDLAPDDTIGWVFANVDSLRDNEAFDGFLDEMVPRAEDALALAVVDATQVFVAYSSYAHASRLSVVRTRTSASDLIDSIRREQTVQGLTETTGPEGLPMWTDETTWTLAAPAENLVLAGPRPDVEQAALKLLDEELGGEDILAGTDGVTFSVQISTEMRDALLGNLDNRMVRRAFEPVQQVEGRITIDGPLTMNGQVLLSRHGNPALLATFLKVGWGRLAPEALSEWFLPAYAERVASGFDASASEGPRNAVDIQFVLPAQDTRLWLDALASADFGEAVGERTAADDGADSQEPSDLDEEAETAPDNSADEGAAQPTQSPSSAQMEADDVDGPAERPAAAAPARSRREEPRTAPQADPVEDAPTTLPP